jgi:hypothetical protein
MIKAVAMVAASGSLPILSSSSAFLASLLLDFYTNLIYIRPLARLPT